LQNRGNHFAVGFPFVQINKQINRGNKEKKIETDYMVIVLMEFSVWACPSKVNIPKLRIP